MLLNISTLYLIFAAYAGIIGTAFSVLIRLVLSAPGVQVFLRDYQLFNVIITAHAFIMIFFMVKIIPLGRVTKYSLFSALFFVIIGSFLVINLNLDYKILIDKIECCLSTQILIYICNNHLYLISFL